ncbi:hypothetical protein J2W56_006661 [Nocardia kruczakiae]|uniref:Uncharacterized protein n=1 Tax=Nocardia kruczakiae TaxID=261477 RepID=A0ABU1XQP8_9NOCA|nr:hypothetical protein [Nocardia kruczakiae]MDR7172895.1 hypothetical protein [Nocardia kruczakiae]
MNAHTSTAASLAALAVALHEVFDASTHTPDSFELWGAIAEEAVRHLSAPAPTSLPQSLAVFTVYRKLRTDARFYPGTGRIEVTSGPLAGTSYPDFDHAARAVATHHAVAGTVPGPAVDLPTWRLNSAAHLAGPFAHALHTATS